MLLVFLLPLMLVNKDYHKSQRDRECS